MRSMKCIMLILCFTVSVFIISCINPNNVDTKIITSKSISDEIINKYKDSDKKPVWIIGNEIIKKINAGEFTDVEEYIDYLVAQKPYSADGTRILEDLYRFVGDRINSRDMFDKWCTKEPTHHSAFIFRGNYFIELAWKHRGTGRGYTVTKEGKELFKKNLKLAEKDLKKAWSINSADPNSAASILTVYKGLLYKETTKNAWFKKAVEADPAAYTAYAKKQDYLRPKWRGSRKKDYDFAQYCDKNAPPKSIIHEIMLDYIMEKARWERNGTMQYYNPYIVNKIKEIVQRTLDNFPDSASIRSKLAEIELLKGNHVKAVELYSEILEKDPGNPDALHKRARVYAINLRKLDLAEKDISKNLESDPYGPDMYDDLSMIATLSGDHKKSIEYFTRAIEKNPKSKQFYLLRGISKIRAFQDYASAAEDFKDVLRLDPLLIDAYGLTAQCLHKLNKPEEANKFAQMGADVSAAKKARENILPVRVPPGLAKEIEKLLNKSAEN